MRITVAIMASSTIYASAHGSIVLTTDKDLWLGTAAPVTALDFTDLALFEFVTDQYADLGVTAADNIYFGAPIPAPGVLAFVAFVGLVSRRRRPA